MFIFIIIIHSELFVKTLAVIFHNFFHKNPYRV